ncbi:MAG: metal ABC transporter substrate-binding protein [Syntrophales bacterium]
MNAMLLGTFARYLFALLVPVMLFLPAQVWSAEAKAREIRVLTSFYPMHIMAMNVLKDVKGITLMNLAPQTMGCLHDYALTPEDMRKLEKADILVANGAGMESYLLRVSQKYPRLKVVELARGIPLIRGEGGPNPHVWLSVAHAITQVKNLSQFMSRVDPGAASEYEKNGREYIARLEALRGEMHDGLDAYRGAPIVTFHEVFAYFADEFGLKIVGVVEREPGSAPSARELAGTIRTIRELRVKALFSEPQYPAAAAETIARETGVRLYPLDPAVTGPVTPGAYIETMKRNLAILRVALK